MCYNHSIKNKRKSSMGILFQGTVVYNGQNIAYRISEMDDKRLDISISFLIGPNENNATFQFNRVDEKYWSLDREQTKSDINIDLKFEKEKERWVFGTDNLLGCGNIQMVYTEKNNVEGKKEPELIIEKSGTKIKDMGETESVSMDKENSVIDIDLDGLIDSLSDEKGIVGKFVISPIVKGLCDDLERIAKEQSEKQQAEFKNTENMVEKTNGKAVLKGGEIQKKNDVVKKTVSHHKVSNNIEKTKAATKSAGTMPSRN